ncbi:MAG TPA: flagellar assembly protein FliH [Thiotrichales bacterium]|nr:flagellar assembly protein FliH [Thiotrichales bacterium]
MTGPRIIRGDKAAVASSWKLPAVEESPGTATEEELPSLPTAEEIEALQKQAWEEAWKKGYQEGLREGREAGEKEIREKGQRLEALMDALARPLDDLDETVEEELVTLAVAVTRQLVRRELRTDPGEVVGVVREALSLLPASARNVRLHLHPEDAELVRAALTLGEEEERAWRIVEDPLQGRGGCQVFSDHSRVDASVETRLAQLVARVFGGERRDDRPLEADRDGGEETS